MQRQLYTVTGQHYEEEEVDHLIQTGEAGGIYSKAIMADSKNVRPLPELKFTSRLKQAGD